MSRKVFSDDALLKEIRKIEEGIRKSEKKEDLKKGDDLENASTDGDLTSDGESMSVNKAMSASDDGSDAESDGESMSEDEDSSEDASPPVKKSKKVNKSFASVGGADLRKGMQVNEFLRDLVGTFETIINDVNTGITTRVDDLQKSAVKRDELHHAFMKTSVSFFKSMAERMDNIETLLGNKPAPAPRARLNKSEVVQRPGLADDGVDALGGRTGQEAAEFLLDYHTSNMAKSEAGAAWLDAIISFETGNYAVECLLPTQLKLLKGRNQ